MKMCVLVGKRIKGQVNGINRQQENVEVLKLKDGTVITVAKLTALAVGPNPVK